MEWILTAKGAPILIKGKFNGDPNEVNMVNPGGNFTKFTTDGGKTWKKFGIKDKHVDDHAIWIDPNNSDHILIGVMWCVCYL